MKNIHKLFFMINNKGTVSVVAIYICIIALFLSIITNNILLENYHYYLYKKHSKNLFIAENMIAKNIYDNYQNVAYHGKNIDYSSKIKKEDNNIKYNLTLLLNGKLYQYEILYDNECQKILSFEDITIISKN